jgi:hypothetical protein
LVYSDSLMFIIELWAAAVPGGKTMVVMVVIMMMMLGVEVADAHIDSLSL